MKKMFYVMIISLIFVVSSIAYGIDWVTPNEDTIAWDAVTSPSGKAVSYRVYLATHGDNINKTLLGETTNLTFTINLPEVGGAFMAGVSTVYNSGLADEAESTINWSIENGESTPNPFGWDLPKAASNLRRQ